MGRKHRVANKERQNPEKWHRIWRPECLFAGNPVGLTVTRTLGEPFPGILGWHDSSSNETATSGFLLFLLDHFP